MNYDDKICELWLGPTGDPIYHFHLPYPDDSEVSPMVGVPTYARKNLLDHGFAFLFVASNNPIWHLTIYHSFNDYFKNSVIYLGTGKTIKGSRFSEIPKEMKGLHDKLLNSVGKVHNFEFSIGIKYGDRFLSKLGLGIGCALLSEDFIKSDSADALRRFMWSKDSKEREKLYVDGSSFANKKLDSLKNMLIVSNGHLVALIVLSNSLYMFTSFYENQSAIILISSDPKHWENEIKGEGIVYIISPGLQKYIGPKSLVDFIAHKIDSYIDEDLKEIEDEMSMCVKLPPYKI